MLLSKSEARVRETERDTESTQKSIAKHHVSLQISETPGSRWTAMRLELLDQLVVLFTYKLSHKNQRRKDESDELNSVECPLLSQPALYSTLLDHTILQR